MENLNEDNIKKSTLQFLKGYYKYRPRKGETEATLDMQGQGGIIADGLLAFTNEDDSKFLSTFEATSNDTRSEVNFKILYRKLGWDGVAIATLTAAVWLVYRYWNEVDFLKEAGYLWVATILLAIILTIVLLIVVSFRRLKRYRYIYAVEQFKRYHANEQWISIGEDIFSSQDDKKFIELKDQCIRNGFGLIKVDENLNPQLIMTPARKETFKKKRKSVQFVAIDDMTNRIKALSKFNFLKRIKLPGQTGSVPLLENMLRFRGKNYPQKVIAFLSVFTILGIYTIELTKSNVNYVNERVYPQMMIDSLSGKSVETRYSIVLDTLFVEPFDSTAIPYLDLVELADQSEKIAAVRKRGSDIVVSTKDRVEYVIYNCARFYNVSEQKYIVEDGVYANIEEAIERMDFLRTNGINSTAMWLGCFGNQPLGYTVYFDDILNDEDEASLIFYDYTNRLKEIEPLERKLRTRILIPDKRFRTK